MTKQYPEAVHNYPESYKPSATHVITQPEMKGSKCVNLGSVHTLPEKYENGVVTLKTHQMFSVHITPKRF